MCFCNLFTGSHVENYDHIWSQAQHPTALVWAQVHRPTPGFRHEVGSSSSHPQPNFKYDMSGARSFRRAKFLGMIFVDPRMSTPAQPRYVPQVGVEPPPRSSWIAEMTEAEDIRW